MGTHFTFVYAFADGSADRYGSISMFDIALSADVSASAPPAPSPSSTRVGGPPQAQLKSPPPPPGPLGVAHWIRAPLSVKHRFGHAAAGVANPCLLSFSVTVRNLSCDVDLLVYIRAGPSKSLAQEGEPKSVAAGSAPSPPVLLHAPSHGHIEWVGRVRCAPVLLPANGSAEVPLQALVHMPGRFDLGGYSIAVEIARLWTDALARPDTPPAQPPLVFERGRAHVLQVVASD